MPPQYAVLIPARNEAGRIGDVTGAVRRRVSAVLVVDDGSTDGTAREAEGAGAEIIVHDRAKGKGAAIATGFNALAKRGGFDACIIMDGDGQHDPADVPKLISVYESGAFDAVFGERRSFQGLPYPRRAWNRLISFFLSAAVDLPWRDTQCGLRLFDLRMLPALVPERAGYEVETELFLKAHWLGLRLGRAEVNAWSRHPPANFPRDARRSLAIAGYALFATLLHSLSQLRRHWRLVAGLALSLGLLTQLLQTTALGSRLFPFAGPGEAKGRELRAAMEWLRTHSREGDVVIAHWYWGHQVVAYAGRPTVATSKAYPSEVAEIKKRFEDLARFFFATNEADAKAVADRYGGRYVFIEDTFPARICRYTSACALASGNRLNARGMRETVAGKMIQGAELEHFKLVFTSPRIRIYEVTDDPRRIPAGDRTALLGLARSAIASQLGAPSESPAGGAPESRHDFFAVGVALWTDGRIRGSQLSIGKSLGEAVRDAAGRAARDERFGVIRAEELVRTRIEVTILKDDIAPAAASGSSRGAIDPMRGYRVAAGSRAGYFLPEVFNAARFGGAGEFFSRLCRNKLKLQNDCYRQKDSRAETFSVEDFIESSPGGEAVMLVGPVAVRNPILTAVGLDRGLRRAADWTAAIQKADGDFPAILDPLRDTAAEPDLARGALAAAVLVDFWERSGEPRYLKAARAHASFVRGIFARQSPRADNSTLAFLVIEYLRLYRAAGDAGYLDDARLFAGRLAASDPAGSSPISTAHAAYALAEFSSVTGDASAERRAGELLSGLRERFRQDRIFGREQSIAANAWLVNIARVLFDSTGRREYADFGLEVGSWLLEQQRMAGSPGTYGPFANTTRSNFAYTRGTGKAAEALADAYRLARALEQDPEPFLRAFRDSMGWLTAMQYDDANMFFIPVESRGKFLGGFRHDYLNTAAWIDSASHFLIAGMGAADMLAGAP